MNAAFRVDASVAVGTGHLMRCLTLADELAARGNTCAFLTRRLPGSLEAKILTRGFSHFLVEDEPGAFVVGPRDAVRSTEILTSFQQRPAWVIVDHYGIGEAWEEQVRPFANRILAIDDLANRRHACDLLLDQNHADPARYQSLVGANTRLLLGPRFVLLRPEFSALAHRVAAPTQLRRLFIFYGGTDPTHESSIAVDALLQSGLHFDEISIVLGAESPQRTALMEKIKGLPGAILNEDVDNIAELIFKADCALGSGSSNIWERSALGVPSLVTITAENQRELALSLDAAGAIRLLGDAGYVNAALIARSLEELSVAPAELAQMSKAGSALTALDGCAKVVDAMMALDD